jgi:beta-N-acetylhexosaminidase
MLQSMRAASFWIAGLFLVFAAANINDPYLVPIRQWGWIAILVGALLGSVFLLGRRRGQKNSLSGRGLLALWCAVPVVLAGAEALFEFRKERVLAATPAEAAALGRHFISGYWQVEDIEPLVEKGLIGGIYVTQHNVADRDPAALRDEIIHLQALRRAAGLPPLRVATDQEGGTVSHLSPPLSRFPPLSNLASLPAEDREKAARAQGENQGRELATLGITLDFAPVVDLHRKMPNNPLDFNSHIGQRAISNDPTIVASIALAFSQGLETAGVQPTAKHFPGLGRVAEDTHHFQARLDTPLADLENSDWQPFRTLLASSNAMLMIGHVTLDAVDPERPASHSKRVIQDIIRRQWGFNGLIVTDDLVMGAIYQHGLCTAVVEALNAGVDLLLVAYDGRQFYRAMDCALAAQRRGEIDLSALASSDERLKARDAATKSVDREGRAPIGVLSH